MNKWAAYDLFGPMRSSTPEEQEQYKKMLKKNSVPIEKVDIFDMIDMNQMYYIRYSANLGFLDVPDWLRRAVDKKLVWCNHPHIIQDIWDLSCSYSEIPSLIVLKTKKEFKVGGAPIKYTDIYGERNALRV